ncbi:NAD(P)-binding domain-containing protein [Streptomyces sp. NRRL WC-3742]|uniref:NAD(P)-binding domain-containing protein n=1 Tax=Streptomyces sp. NRRL WC-3742 TaxID=1463934 RepID=UPI0004CB5DFE|nr:NAD(P)-binding domain-containing protein [Streptomyces sp. NRRL WC-3742]
MRTVVIGAGPAGLTCVRQALAAGLDVRCHEKRADLGGIWNPAGGGAYPGVRMQSSRMSMPFSDHPPGFAAAFPTQQEVQEYLRSYAARFGLLDAVSFGSEVVRVAKAGSSWQVTSRTADGREHTEAADSVLVANGELWQPRRPRDLPPPGAPVRVLTAPEYLGPAAFAGQRVLVVGGGVSGADIAADLGPAALRVDWSVRRHQLFLPRLAGGAYNDALFSYAGRVAVEDVPYPVYLDWLAELLPEYMAMYRSTGLLPEAGFHGAVHVNDRIVARVHAGDVHPVPAFSRFAEDGSVEFADGSRRTYDAVVLCLGYEMPDYGFLEGLRREDLYEHHFWRHDPSLAVVNTPVDTEAFGTACPYFEAVAGWVVAVATGKATLPDAAARADWCERHMGALHERRYLDCWLETVRLGLLSGSLPDPAVDFAAYWTVVSSQVAPGNLGPGRATPIPAVLDDRLDLAGVRHRILAALPPHTRERLLAEAVIGPEDLAAAAAVPAGRELAPWLPYRQREHGPEGAGA